jgi:CHAT domain-containing protein
MKRILLPAALIISFTAHAQFDTGGLLNKAKDKAKEKAEEKKEETKQDLKDKAKNAAAQKLDNVRKEYDESNFNYAISFSDNAGLFETKEKGERNKVMLIEAVKSSDQEVESPSERAYNSNNTGELFYASGKFKAAEAAFKSAKYLYEQDGQGESKEMALVLSNLGLLYHTTGRYTLADDYTKRALEMRERVVPESAMLAASINNKAVLYKDMGRFNEAEQLIEKAVSLNSSTLGKKSLAYALALNNKAMLFQAIGRNDAAEGLMKESISIAKEQLKENSSNYIKLTINLALLYQDMKKYSEAEKIYLDAIALKEKQLGKNHPDYAHLKKGLASLYLIMGKTDAVEGLLQTAADIYKRKLGENHPSYAAAISDLGNFYRMQNRLAEAEPLLTKSLSIRKILLGEGHPDYIRALEDMAILQWRTGRTKEAAANYKTVIGKTTEYIDEYFAPMSESEKAKFWDKVMPRFQRFNSFAADAMHKEKELAEIMFNNQLNTKALLFNSTSKVRNMIMNSGDEQLVKNYLHWLDQKENLARLYTLSKEELAEEKVNLDSLEAETNAMEKKLSATSKTFTEGYAQANYTWQDIARTLGETEAVIDIVQFRKFGTDSVYYAAMVVNKTSPAPTVIIIKNGSDLENKYVKQYRSAIKDLKDDPDAYTQFWSKIDKAVSGKTKLYLSLDGVYNQVSMNTLKDASGKYLIDSKTLVLVGNAKDVLKLKSAAKPRQLKTADLFGFPNYGEDEVIAPLPGTKVEVENISKTLTPAGYKLQTYMADNANEANVKASKAEILHIATHGFFLSNLSNVESDKVLGIEASTIQKNPLHRSGILLSGCEMTILGENGDHSTSNNGILTAYEAMNMSLDNTDLVVLSACETGLGDIKTGEGVYGLQRSFQVAGARSVIMSLWQVSDEATQQLMSSFYKNLAVSGNKQDAFLKAQKEIKTKFPQPFYWGAFVLVGN